MGEAGGTEIPQLLCDNRIPQYSRQNRYIFTSRHRLPPINGKAERILDRSRGGNLARLMHLEAMG